MTESIYDVAINTGMIEDHGFDAIENIKRHMRNQLAVYGDILTAAQNAGMEDDETVTSFIGRLAAEQEPFRDNYNVVIFNLN